ncbi:LysM peptidoglycan-binding domain-containing protein [Paenibacillus yanchengensis]|uniref:LysM peptidoglycan-binding domain-containing protein n=1 Tax=Paenibacillus yanchengensis TaxID=2035833 RepID=A0ABW4YQ18_9BACL
MYIHTSSYKSIYGDNRTEESRKYSNKVRYIKEFTRLQSKVVINIIVLTLFLSISVLVTINASDQYSDQPQVGEYVVFATAGDTLWSIAQQYGPNNKDVRQLIHKIKDRNLLTSSEILIGQRLIIPKF